MSKQHKFKPGDLAIYIKPNCDFHNTLIEILSNHKMITFTNDEGITETSMAYEVDFGIQPPTPYTNWVSRRENLKPIPPEETKGSWEDCVWKPRETINVI